MNKGICIPVADRTVAGFIERLARASSSADLLELRFDSLSRSEFNCEDIDSAKAVLREIFELHSTTPWITTFRPREHGGEREISAVERTNFWGSGFETEIADLEEDLVEDSWYWLWGERICSFHDFAGVPENLESLFAQLAETKAETIKIAVLVGDAADAVPVWKLFADAEKFGSRIIPIAMGEAGKWTRILGLAHGAPITYAAFDGESSTAPGQITARDLRRVYRVNELDRDTAVFGVVAGDTSYSLSPYMHNAAFAHAGINSVFVPFQVADIAAFLRRMVRSGTREIDINIRGLSVTNPHKQTIIEHLDDIDETARSIGAVNTVKIDGRKLIGYNTDAPGFITPLRDAFGDLRGSRVTVAGAGGAARACIYALRKDGAEVTVLARDSVRAAQLADEFGVRIQELITGDRRPETIQADILVNTTPLGTRGSGENESIATADELCGVKLVYDLVYNPTETRLLREARLAGAKTMGGLEMLIAQGARQFEIWTGREAPFPVMRSAVSQRLK